MAAELLTPTHDSTLVVASFLISAVGAYSALTAMSTVRSSDGVVNKLNTGFAGLALGGVGIWAMHFLGMLAWNPGVAQGYRLIETLGSLLVAVATSAVALGYMATGPFSIRRLAIAGPLAGLGVAAMHFLGMGSMRFGGYLQWNIGIAALAVLIAVVAATAALWLAFNVRSNSHRIGASLLMAAAVCTMHYTGMAAADVVCTTADRYAQLPGLLYRSELQTLVIMVAVSVATLIGLDVWFQRVMQEPDKARGAS
jgi:NO-binding membrane sensor protein with MHYT domain